MHQTKIYTMKCPSNLTYMYHHKGARIYTGYNIELSMYRKHIIIYYRCKNLRTRFSRLHHAPIVIDACVYSHTQKASVGMYSESEMIIPKSLICVLLALPSLLFILVPQ